MNPKGKRIRLSVSLRAFLLVVMLFTVLLGGLARRYHQWQRLHQELAELGPLVHLEYPCSRGHASTTLTFIAEVVCIPAVLEVKFHGDWAPPPPEYDWSYGHIITENIDDSKLATLVEVLSRLKKCPKISLIGTDVTDEGLLELHGLSSLDQLNLTGAKITDIGMINLDGLKLTSLILRYTKLTDAGLQHLKNMRQLRMLDLSGTQVTDSGLQHLKGLPELETLSLRGTQVTDAGLQHLKNMRQLRMLDLSGTQVTDAGLQHLKGLPELETLRLWNTQVTDVVVRAALPNVDTQGL